MTEQDAVPGPPQIEKVEQCPVCDSRRLERLYECRDRLHGLPGRFGLMRCLSCGSGLLSPRPISSELGSYYPDHYRPYSNRGSAVRHAPVWRRLLRRALLLIPAVLPDASRRLWSDLRRPPQGAGQLLDVGCGDGRLLPDDIRAGWHAIGVDFSATAVERARTQGLDVRLGTLEDVELAPRSFDLIRMTHLIEHLGDPGSALRRAYELLRPGGRVHILTPNFSSPTSRLLGTYWLNLDAPRHLILFTPASLRRLAGGAGFAIECEVHEVAPSDFWASVHYWLRERRPEGLFARLPDLKYSLFLRSLLYPTWWLLARARRGERMHFVLLKPADGS